MSSQQELLRGAMVRRAAVGLAILLAAASGAAQNNNGDYVLLIASGFLCDTGDSYACPAVVKAADDSSYEMSGVGTINANGKVVTAMGTFTHKSPNGNTVETGIWMANELVSFVSYGVAPSARTQAGPTFGPPVFGQQRMPVFSGSMPAGGLAVIRVRLMPMWGLSRNAVLQVNCALGKVPDDRQTDGIRLSIEGGGGEFDQEMGGRTMFVVWRGASPAPKSPPRNDEINPQPARPQPRSQ